MTKNISSMLDLAIKRISEERENKEAQVAWIWGETPTRDRYPSPIYFYKFLKNWENQPIPIEVLKSYLKAQKEDTISDAWKLKFL